MELPMIGWKCLDQWKTAHIYKGFQIVEYTVGGIAYDIYKDKEPYSALRCATIKVACMAIDKHLDKQFN